jgi:hypothetical protein
MLAGLRADTVVGPIFCDHSANLTTRMATYSMRQRSEVVLAGWSPFAAVGRSMVVAAASCREDGAQHYLLEEITWTIPLRRVPEARNDP